MGNMYKSKLNDIEGGGSTAVLLGTTGETTAVHSPADKTYNLEIVSEILNYTHVMFEIRDYQTIDSGYTIGYSIIPVSQLTYGGSTLISNMYGNGVEYSIYNNTLSIRVRANYIHPINIYGINFYDILP